MSSQHTSFDMGVLSLGRVGETLKLLLRITSSGKLGHPLLYLDKEMGGSKLPTRVLSLTTF